MYQCRVLLEISCNERTCGIRQELSLCLLHKLSQRFVSRVEGTLRVVFLIEHQRLGTREPSVEVLVSKTPEGDVCNTGGERFLHDGAVDLSL